MARNADFPVRGRPVEGDPRAQRMFGLPSFDPAFETGLPTKKRLRLQEVFKIDRRIDEILAAERDLDASPWLKKELQRLRSRRAKLVPGVSAGDEKSPGLPSAKHPGSDVERDLGNTLDVLADFFRPILERRK